MSLESKGVGEDSFATWVIASELDSDESLLMVEDMPPDVIGTSKSDRASFNWTWQALSRLDLSATQLVRSPTSGCSKGLATIHDIAVEPEAVFPFTVDLFMVL